MSTQLSTVLESIDLLSSEERRVVEVRLAMLRLSPDRQARLLELGLDLGALTDDLDAYVQGATNMLPGSVEDVLCAASHVSAYVEMDESDRGAEP